MEDLKGVCTKCGAIVGLGHECNDILARLAEIDRKSIRAMRAGEADRLAELEAEAVQLRQQLG